jgi:hypothetical protein
MTLSVAAMDPASDQGGRQQPEPEPEPERCNNNSSSSSWQAEEHHDWAMRGAGPDGGSSSSADDY